MTSTQTSRAERLAAEFNASKLIDRQAALDGASHRRAIVREMLTFMTPRQVAETLGVSKARVGQIVGGVRQ